MRIADKEYRSIWFDEESRSVSIIDQTRLPFEFSIRQLRTCEDVCEAITQMQVRGAPLIGVSAAYGLALALAEQNSARALQEAAQKLLATRPTAVNLRWAIHGLLSHLDEVSGDELADAAFNLAHDLAEQDVAANISIGRFGIELIRDIAEQKSGEPVQLMTHCNAGALATVDRGTALAPVYAARDEDLPVHVWVSETRPRNQGALLTAWELAQAGIAHTLIVDSAAGHLMQQGAVDLCMVGADRITASGAVCNKIGTYLKALAARESDVPFYVCAPASTFDWSLSDDNSEIPIEQRAATELTHWTGQTARGELMQVATANQPVEAFNPAFDITPGYLISALITDQGVFNADDVGNL